MRARALAMLAVSLVGCSTSTSGNTGYLPPPRWSCLRAGLESASPSTPTTSTACVVGARQNGLFQSVDRPERLPRRARPGDEGIRPDRRSIRNAAARRGRAPRHTHDSQRQHAARAVRRTRLHRTAPRPGDARVLLSVDTSRALSGSLRRASPRRQWRAGARRVVGLIHGFGRYAGIDRWVSYAIGDRAALTAAPITAVSSLASTSSKALPCKGLIVTMSCTCANREYRSKKSRCVSGRSSASRPMLATHTSSFAENKSNRSDHNESGRAEVCMLVQF
jgi:hypothetical protein